MRLIVVGTDYKSALTFVLRKALCITTRTGGRISELLDLKVKDVLLYQQKYRVLIAKGKQYKWGERVIKDVAFDLWEKSLYNRALMIMFFQKD